jgi:hypothetical protein
MVLVSCTPLAVSKTQTALPVTVFAPTQTLIPTKTNIPTLTSTATAMPSLTPTLTLVPQSSILFQRTFEDDIVGQWAPVEGIWEIVQESDGNHCLSGSAHSAPPPQIWYHTNIYWTDYALETRVKLIKGNTLFILIRSNVTANGHLHYGVAFGNGLGLIQTWASLNGNVPFLVYPDKWYTVRVEIKGDALSAYVDNSLSQEITLQAPLIKQGGFGYVIGEEDKVCLDDIKAWELK